MAKRARIYSNPLLARARRSGASNSQQDEGQKEANLIESRTRTNKERRLSGMLARVHTSIRYL